MTLEREPSELSADARLVDRARTGDRDATAELYRFHERLVVGTLVRVIRSDWSSEARMSTSRGTSYSQLASADLALEVAAESFMSALHTYDAARGARFSTWWVTRARWTFKTQLRRLSRDRLVVGREINEGDWIDPSGDCFEVIAADEVRRGVREVLAELPEMERKVLLLVGVTFADERASVELAAGSLKMSKQDTRSLLRRARRHFRDAWVRSNGDPDENHL